MEKITLFVVGIFATVFCSGYTVGTMAFSETAKVRKPTYLVPLQEYVYVEAEPEPEPAVVNETEQPKLKSLGIYKLTAYCACSRCCGKCDGITATGTKATAGRTIAVDPSKIPYGTEVIVNGHNPTYIAEDCGGAINGNKIDIFFNSHAEALKFGVQYAEVFVKLR